MEMEEAKHRKSVMRADDKEDTSTQAHCYPHDEAAEPARAGTHKWDCTFKFAEENVEASVEQFSNMSQNPAHFLYEKEPGRSWDLRRRRQDAVCIVYFSSLINPPA